MRQSGARSNLERVGDWLGLAADEPRVVGGAAVDREIPSERRLGREPRAVGQRQIDAGDAQNAGARDGFEIVEDAFETRAAEGAIEEED
jgi:hypothetical protein